MDDVLKRILDKPVRLIDQLRTDIRARNLSYSTKRTYIHWILRFIRFHGTRHPGNMGGSEIEAFLNHLSVKRQ